MHELVYSHSSKLFTFFQPKKVTHTGWSPMLSSHRLVLTERPDFASEIRQSQQIPWGSDTLKSCPRGANFVGPCGPKIHRHVVGNAKKCFFFGGSWMEMWFWKWLRCRFQAGKIPIQVKYRTWAPHKAAFLEGIPLLFQENLGW